MSQEVDVLVTIRKIIRATDLYSRQLSKKSGLTAPQLLVLQAIREMGAVAISRLAARVSRSQATVGGGLGGGKKKEPAPQRGGVEGGGGG